MPICKKSIGPWKCDKHVHTYVSSQETYFTSVRSRLESSEVFVIFLQILSRDSVTVAVDAVVYYKVFNPIVAIANVENFR